MNHQPMKRSKETSGFLRYCIYALCFITAVQGETANAQSDDPPFSTDDTNVGYIDAALPMTQFRLRFDAAYDNPTPDRSEFFYRASTAATGTPISPAETSVDYQDIRAYLEYSPSELWSVFIDVPFRFLNPELNSNASGFGDLRVGGKALLFRDADQVLSTQLRVYVPTGDADRLLGTDHVSIEPALLYAKRLNQQTVSESELQLWIPIDGTEINGEPFAGPILRIGTGLGHDLFRRDCGPTACDSVCDSSASQRLTFVAEFVGWLIMDGNATTPSTPALAQLIDVDGDTIINSKIGLRWTQSGQSFYVGYGRSLTGDVWYENIVRTELVFRF